MLPGNLLVSAPGGEASPLNGRVILILEHSEEGTTGVVLNSHANEAMKSWCRHIAQQEDKEAVYAQLQEVASSAAQMADQGSLPPLTVCMQRPAESMEEMVGELGRGVRIFVGRISWGAGELARQALAGAWMITPGSPELVFGDHENLWATCVRRVGDDVLLSAPGIHELSENVLLN